jgi:hypothetical protein
MKNYVKQLRLGATTTALFVSFAFAGAQSPEKIQLSVKESKIVLIESAIISHGNASVKITDAGLFQEVYSEEIPMDNRWKRTYNLTKLPEGTYRIQVNLNDFVYDREIQIDDQRSVVKAESDYAIPEFSENGKSLYVKFSASNDEKVTVSFLKDSEEFFSNVIEAKAPFSQPYSLENLSSGDYFVEVRSGEKVFGYTLRIL